MKKFRSLIIFICVVMCLSLCACGGNSGSSSGETSGSSDQGGSSAAYTYDDISAELTYDHSMELEYAQQFTVDFYTDGCALITIADADQYLFVPVGAEIPADVPDDVVVIIGPVSNTYIAGTADMDFFAAMGALDSVAFCSLEAEDWYIGDVADAVESGDILYAGKYSAPNYEMILSGGCDLVVENTMISHSPAILEQLQNLGFPVLIDYSSYESTVCGRMEWIKLYGLLAGKSAEAEEAFETQEAIASVEYSQTDANVAFFYFTSSGTVNVRTSDDYVAEMISLAGGHYTPDDLPSYNESTSATIQMEEFVVRAQEADFLVYNSSIAGEVSSVADILRSCPQLENCPAVVNGNVYCTSESIYQSVMELGSIVSDFHSMMNGGNGMTYIYHLD